MPNEIIKVMEYNKGAITCNLQGCDGNNFKVTFYENMTSQGVPYLFAHSYVINVADHFRTERRLHIALVNQVDEHNCATHIELLSDDDPRLEYFVKQTELYNTLYERMKLKYRVTELRKSLRKMHKDLFGNKNS